MYRVPRSVLRIALPMLLLLLPLAPFGGAKCAGTIAGLRHRSDEATAAAHVSASKSRRAVVTSQFSKWPGSVLPYTISDTLGEPGKAVVAAAIDAYTKQSCVKIRPWAGERDYVTFTRGTSCSSNIGRIGLQQFINIGSDCEVAGKVMHEIYHALGRWHEHCRPDRDLYVKINEKNIIPGDLSGFTIVNSAYTTVQGLPYDFDSIMHYEATAFSVNAQHTIQPLNLSVSLDRLGQRERLSLLDLQHLAILYCGGWGQWTQWSECSAECGRGVRRRSRMCASKALCGGDETQEEPCNLEPCPAWSDWSEWTLCNVSCGHGYQHRTRVCIDGTKCSGNNVEALPCLGTMCTSSSTPPTTSVPSVDSTILPSLISTSSPATIIPFLSVTPAIIQRTTSVMPAFIQRTTSVTPVVSVIVQPGYKTTSVGVAATKTIPSEPASDLHPMPTPVAMETSHTTDGSQWSLCSHSCGGGTQFKVVAAPQGTERRPCNTQPCLTVVCEQSAQLCSTGQGLRNQDCLSNGTESSQAKATLTLHPLNTTSQRGNSPLLQCAWLALSTGYSSFAIIADRCYLGNGFLLDEAPPTNCTKPCAQQERLVGCFYEITDSVLLKHSTEKISQANCCHDSNAYSGVSSQQSHAQNAMIATLFLLSRLL